MRVVGDGGTATCHARPFRVFPHGLWYLQATPDECKPKKPPKPVLHLSRAALTGEHGPEVETDQDSHLTGGIVEGGNSHFVVFIYAVKESC